MPNRLSIYTIGHAFWQTGHGQTHVSALQYIRSSKMKIFVYGAKGMVGHALVDQLLAAGHEVFAGTRKPEEGRKQSGLTWVAADATKPALGTEVLEKVDRAFFISPPGFTDQYSILNPWLEKAKSVKLGKFVLMTAMGVEHAPPEAPFRKLELALESSGLTWNILRPNWFMQNFQTFWIGGILKDKKIYFPGGQAKASFIDARDIAASAAALLLKDDQKNKALNITGPRAISHDEVAAILSGVTGAFDFLCDITPEDFKAGLLSGGVPEDYAGFLVYIAGALKEGPRGWSFWAR
jgi:uncharacterized protein YbjT (DUF2867 family)